MRTLNARELDDLVALASRGGIGRATALTDCVAEGPDQLMYIQGDDLVLLRDHGTELLAWCEGEVGWVKRENIDVAMDELASTSGSEKSSFDTPRSDMPATVLIAPSPPPAGPFQLPLSPGPLHLNGLGNPRRESGPFELESPDKSPGTDEEARKSYLLNRDSLNNSLNKWRNSGMSASFSDGLGGIGGLMMANKEGIKDERPTEQEAQDGAVEQIRDDLSPDVQPLEEPVSTLLTATNASPARGRVSPISINSEGSGSDWDIYGDYARDSMYRSNRASRISTRFPPDVSASASDSESGIDGSRDAAWSALNASSSTRRTAPSPSPHPQANRDAVVDHEDGSSSTGRPSLDDPSQPNDAMMSPPNRPPRRRPRALTLTPTLDQNPSDPNTPIGVARQRSHTPTTNPVRSPPPGISPRVDRENTATPVNHIEADTPYSAGRSVATELRLRLQRERAFSPTSSEDTSDFSSSSRSHPTSTEEETVVFGASSTSSLPTTIGPLLASPLPPDDPPPSQMPELLDDLIPPPPPGMSPRFSPGIQQGVWTPNSPASPHSVAATQQAVEATWSTPELTRARAATLVGRVEVDLSAAKGPVPITFLIGGSHGGPHVPSVHPSEPRKPVRDGIGLGMPSALTLPNVEQRPPQRHATMPPTPLQTPPTAGRPQNSRFPPTPIRTLTSPTYNPASAPPTVSNPPPMSRPRSRSFSAAFSRAVGKGKKENGPPLVIDTSAPPLPVAVSSPPIVSPPSADSRRGFLTRKASKGVLSPDRSVSPSLPPPLPLSLPSASSSTINLHQTDSQVSLPLSSAMSTSFSFRGSKPPLPLRKGSRPLPSPVSHKDFADPTVRADGLDFEIIQPKKTSKLPGGETSPDGSLPTPASDILTTPTTSSSLRPRPETDEWGFIKDKSPIPEIFQSRQAASDVRTTEQKWLGIINTPLAPGGVPPKKVRKLVLDAGVPASLRGRVWAWFMSGEMSARKPGLFQELLTHDRGLADAQIEHDVKTVYLDHSIFSEPNGPGQQDLRSLLRAYSNFAPAGYRHEMALIAGALLIHCVVEDSFWLLAGLVNGVLKTYYAKDKTGLRVDVAVFLTALHGAEPKVAKMFKDLGVNCQAFLERWWTTLFIRCLPWPTVLRVFDSVISEGPRFLIVASLAIISLSRDRLLSLPPSPRAVVDYLCSLPQDGLFLPDHFMKSCEHVKFKDEDLRKIRSNVEKEMGLGM